jgi:hypothetical protein
VGTNQAKTSPIKQTKILSTAQQLTAAPRDILPRAYLALVGFARGAVTAIYRTSTATGTRNTGTSPTPTVGSTSISIQHMSLIGFRSYYLCQFLICPVLHITSLISFLPSNISLSILKTYLN